jgi:hypothetical protein
MGFLIHLKKIQISKVMRCVHRKMKHVVKKCEDKMGKYVVSHEAHHGIIPIFNCKNAC